MAASKNGQFMGMEMPEFMDFSKFAGQFAMPEFDAKSIIEAQRKNIEAIAAANRIALEGAQAVSQRQVEIMRQAWDESTSAVKELTTVGKPEEKLVKQAEMVKHGLEVALSNVRELTEMSTKSNSEAVELLNKRVFEMLDEVKGELSKLNK